MPKDGTPTFATELARRIEALTARPLPVEAVQTAKVCIADTVAVALAGLEEECVQVLLRTPGIGDTPGSCTVWGTARRTSALEAALVNGTASHALDYDDLCAVFGGHHSAPIVAPILALGQQLGSTGEQLVRAYVVGVETEVRLARALLPKHYDKGWHPTSTIGVFGVAAACSVLLRNDVRQTATALSIAASGASGIKANFGSMTKPLHVGACSRAGLMAALLAQNGFDAGAMAFEGQQGFFNVYNGADGYDREQALQGWGEPFEIAGPSVGIKQFPCCGSTHASITATLRMLEQTPFAPQDVASVEILPNKHRLVHTNKPVPQTALEGKFSVQYVVARALMEKSVRLDHFTDAAVQDPHVSELLSKVSARPHPTLPDRGVGLWGSEVLVQLRDGRKLSSRVEDLSCRDRSYPMSSSELWEKFRDCASTRLAPRKVQQLYGALDELCELQDCRRLTELLAVEDPSAT